MLPGLGVLFEVIWQNSSEDEKNEMLTILEEGLKRNKCRAPARHFLWDPAPAPRSSVRTAQAKKLNPDFSA